MKKHLNCQLFSFLFSLAILPASVYSQEKPTRISGKVFSQEATSLPNCNVVIQAINNPKLIAFTTTGERNEFHFALHWNISDSILITISHTGYETEKIKALFIPGNTYYWDVTLRIIPKTLEEVTVAPPIWKHGDTTSYSVSFFKEPTDLKLIDVINNMPGFKVDDDGIYFKGKKVKKITLNNGELFSDKINLLATNLPAEGLQTVQALEHQNMNQKLKGLTGDNEVFVNLVTKKNTIFFGDMEAGAGTLGRYKVNPVVFRLHNNVKAGLIADWDNSGKTMSPGDNSQLKGDTYARVTAGSIHGEGIYIPNFNQSRYVKNHLGDARLSVNWNLSKRLKNNTEFSFIKDNRIQTSHEIAQILSGDSIIQRIANNRVNIRPNYIQGTNNVLWDINNNSTLKANFMFSADNNLYKANSDIRQTDLPYSSSSTIKNNWNTFFAHVDFTNRISVRKALEIQTDAGLFDLPQIINSHSPNWPTLFMLPDSSYQQLYQPYSNRLLYAKTTINYILGKGKRIITYNLTGEYQRLHTATTLDFISSNGKQRFTNEAFSGKGAFSTKSLTSDFNYNFYLIKLLFAASANVGVVAVNTEENPIEKNYLEPVINFRISQKSKIYKNVENRFEINYNQTPLNIYSYRSKVYPTGVAAFEQNKFSGLPLKQLSFDHKISFFAISSSSLSFSQGFNLNFTNTILTPSNNGLVFISTDSVISDRITKSYFNNLFYIFPVVFLNAQCTVSGSLRFSEGFINTGEKIALNNFNSKNFSIELKRNWKRTTYLSFKSGLYVLNSHLRGIASSNGFKPTLNLLNTLSLKTQVANTLEAKFGAEWIQNNISSPQSVKALFADCELLKTFEGSKVSLRLKVENIFNEKQYLIAYRNVVNYQSLYTIPLIKRNILVTVRYGL